MRTLHIGDLRLEKLPNGAIEIRVDIRTCGMSMAHDRKLEGEQLVAIIDPHDVPKLRELVSTNGGAA